MSRGNMASLLELAGGVPTGVTDYNVRSRYKRSEVLPTGEETLAEMYEKVRKWNDIITRKESLAVAFGMLEQGVQEVDFEKEARKVMTAQEGMLYDSWKKKASLPTLRPLEDRETWHDQIKNKDRATEMRAALRMAYRNNFLDLENLAWFMKKYEVLLPLLTAIMRIGKARRAWTDNEKRDARDFQEALAVDKAVAAHGAVVQKTMRAMREMTTHMSTLMAPVQGRGKAMQPAGSKKAQKTIQGELATSLLGGQVTGRPVKWTAPVHGAGRLERARQQVESAKAAGKRKAVEITGGPSEAGDRSPVYRPQSPLAWEYFNLGGDEAEEEAPEYEDEEMEGGAAGPSAGRGTGGQ